MKKDSIEAKLDTIISQNVTILERQSRLLNFLAQNVEAQKQFSESINNHLAITQAIGTHLEEFTKLLKKRGEPKGSKKQKVGKIKEIS